MRVYSKAVRRRNVTKWLFYGCLIILPLIQFCIMYVGVNINSLFMAFKSYDSEAGWQWIGFGNFKSVFYDINRRLPELTYSFKNSIICWLISLLVTLPLGLLFAFYVYKKYWGSKFFRVILFLPSIISGAVLAAMYKYYADTFMPGVINTIFGTNLKGFLSVEGVDFWAIVFFNIFIGFGPSVLMYTGAMVNIPKEVGEAARLDGANAFVEFVKIVLPQIFGTVSVFIITGVAAIFVNQMNLYSIYFNEADTHLFTMGYYTYMKIQKAGTSYGIYPYFATLSLLLTSIIAPLILFLNWFFKKIDPMKS